MFTPCSQLIDTQESLKRVFENILEWMQMDRRLSPEIEDSIKIRSFPVFSLDRISLSNPAWGKHLSQTLNRKEPTGGPEWGLGQLLAHRGEYSASKVGSEICKAWLPMEIGKHQTRISLVPGGSWEQGRWKFRGRWSRAEGLLSILGGLIQESLNTLKAKVQRSFPGIKVVWGLGN